MHQVIRLTSASVLGFALGISAQAKDAAKPSEYRQDDNNLYLKADVLKANPDAVILPESAIHVVAGQSGTQASYFLPARHHPARAVYFQQVADWVEPITPPNMPLNLNIPLDVMQIREPHGDVQVALPSAPANFNTVSDGMVLSNGAVIKTGGSGTVAVLFGGVDSVRLTPNSQAAVQLLVTPTMRDAEVDLHAGVAFSKVGLRIGEKEDYEVHTPYGVVSAHGTDFAVVALPQRVDVWVATGTVRLLSPEDGGVKTQTVTAEAKGPLKVMRYPLAKDAQAAMAENAETLTAALSFIPMINQKLKTLTDQVTAGTKPTPTETAYLGRIRKVDSLIKLTLVPPPAPPRPMPVAPPAPVAPVTEAKAPEAAPADAAVSTAPDPNSLTPKNTVPKDGAPASSNSGGMSVRLPKVSLDLRDQDGTSTSTTSKPAASSPNQTAP